MSDHVLIAHENLRHLFNNIPTLKVMRLSEGTGSHVFGEGSSEVLLSKYLRAEYRNKDIHYTNHGEIDINGVVIDYAHHGPNSGSTKWVEGNALSSYTINTWTRLVSVINRIDRLYTVVNGTSDAGVVCTALGKYFSATDPLNIGANNIGTERFSGQIGAIMFIRFDDIAASNFVRTTYTPGMPITGGGAEVVLWIDPRLSSSATAMLQDYSGNGNSLTGVNIDTTNRTRIV
jgi:hypothetical protein